MNLVTRFLAAQRDRLLMRLGCWLVCFSLVLGLMLPQQRAEALVAELTMASAVAYLGACGLPFITKGMDKDDLVSSVQRLIQEFLDTELGGITIQDWLGSVWNLAVIAGKLIMGRPLTEEFVGFAQWVAGKYATQAGENVVYTGDGYTISFADGTQYICGSRSRLNGKFVFYPPSNVTKFSLDTWYDLPNGWKFGFFVDGPRIYHCYLCPDGSAPDNDPLYTSFRTPPTFDGFCLSYNPSAEFPYLTFFYSGDLSSYVSADFYMGPSIFSFSASDGSLSIDRAPSMSYIPEGIEAEQGIALGPCGQSPGS